MNCDAVSMTGKPAARPVAGASAILAATETFPGMRTTRPLPRRPTSRTMPASMKRSRNATSSEVTAGLEPRGAASRQ